MEQALTWQALQWPDGTRYEGLTKDGKMHSHGVLTFPNKDRYEGQFEGGQMHGAGVYVWSSGTIYRGDWVRGAMHGCGTTLRKQHDGRVAASEGKYFGGAFVGDVMPCSQEDGHEAAVEADVAAFQARSFTQWRQQQQQQDQEARKQPWQGMRWKQQPGQQASGQLQQGAGGVGAAAAGGHTLDEQQQHKLEGLVQHLAAQPLKGRQR